MCQTRTFCDASNSIQDYTNVLDGYFGLYLVRTLHRGKLSEWVALTLAVLTLVATVAAILDVALVAILIVVIL